MQKLLQAWHRAICEEQFAEARAFCAPNGARRRALHEARMARQQAQRLAKIIRRRYGVDPVEVLRNGEIK